MHLTPREQEKLLLFTAGEVARRRRDRGLKLNHPEAIALISAELLEGAREGKSVSELMSFGASLLSEDDVMQGVAEMIDTVQIEATFPDGTKLVTVHHPIRPSGHEADQDTSAPQEGAHPGETIICDEPIVINEGRKTRTITVINTGDRPVQVGSHYHFAQVNPALEFEREQADGFRLDIPAGTSARFEPRDAKEIRLVEYGGNRNIHGFRQGAPEA